jgi:phosphonate transport system substrate-binding protein
MHRRPFLLAAGTALAAPAFVRAQSRPVLKVGLGPQQPTQADTKRVWEPVFRRACDQIGADLDLTVANDWAGISVALATRQIDVAQMGPWGYVLAKQKGDAQAIAMLQIQGRDHYRAIVVARPGLALSKVPDDAKGMSMQMLDVGSTSGWLVPTHFMRARGIDPKTYFGRYAEGASAAAAQMATANGQVDLATGWDTHRNTMLRNGQLKPDSNRVVWESDPLPNEPVVVRRDFDPELARRLQAALTSIPAGTASELLPWPYSGYVATTHEPYAMLERMGRDVGVLKA